MYLINIAHILTQKGIYVYSSLNLYSVNNVGKILVIFKKMIENFLTLYLELWLRNIQKKVLEK